MSKVTKKSNAKSKGKGKQKQAAKEKEPTDEKTKEFPEIIGFGKFEFQNKIVYIGSYKQLKDGRKVRDGYGKIIHPTNDNSDYGREYYEGEWKDDKMCGFGIYHYSNGDVYEGEWLDDMHHGFGKYFFTDGNRYEGEWKNNKYHGVGIEEGNTFYYEGCFQNGKREGLGCYYDYETQQSFIGNWVNGYKEGKFCVKNLFTGEYSVKTFNEWSNL